MEKLLDNWQQRSFSEKIVIAVVGVLVICTLFFLLVVDPIVSWRAQQQKQLNANTRVLSQVTSLVRRFEQQSSSDTQIPGGLAMVIDQSLQKNGLTMRGFQPGRNNEARLRLSNVAYEPFVQWLHDLEYKYHISIEELSITQAKSPGLLMASIRVKQ